MNNKKTNGFYIPTGLAKQSKLTKQTGKDKGKQVNFEWHTKAVYSIYHYFTFNCDGLGYCTITAEEVANRLGVSLRTVRYCRQLLKECNYITTDGGIKTTALIEYKEGCTDCHHNKEIIGAQIVTVEEKESAEGCTDCQQGVHRLSTEGAQIVTEGCTDCHHNKERIKNNKESNKESISIECSSTTTSNNEKVLSEKGIKVKSDAINTEVNNDNVTVTNETAEDLILFTFEGFGGLDDVLLSKSPYCETESLSYSQRVEGSKWFWEKWNAYTKYVTGCNLPFEKVNQYNRTFLHIVSRYYTGDKLQEVKGKLNTQITAFMRAYLMNRWKLFVSHLSDFSNKECKRIRMQFEKVVSFFFKDCENYNAVCDIMGEEYYEAWGCRKQVVDISAVDNLYDSDYTLQEATELLQNSNLSKDEIKRRWDELNSSTCEVSDILPTAKTQYCNTVTNGDMLERGFIPNVDYKEF